MTTLYDTRPPALEESRWRLDPARSTAEFRVRHFWGLVTVEGHFEDLRGRLDLRPGRQPAVDLTLHADSLQAGNGKRDRHLCSADFFDVDNHPLVRFTSESAVLAGDTLTVRGDLEAAGRQIQFELGAPHRRRVGGGSDDSRRPSSARHDLEPTREAAQLALRARLVRDR